MNAAAPALDPAVTELVIPAPRPPFEVVTVQAPPAAVPDAFTPFSTPSSRWA